ncbi:MAG: alkaline phosphatase PhoX [Phycisphaeraceae bacterium]
MTQTAAVTAGFAGLRSFAGTPRLASALVDASAGYGPLIADPEGVLDLPRGFSYHVISRTGETMTDGFIVPGKHDGMAAFAGPDGLTVVVRNHEINNPRSDIGPFGKNNRLFGKLPRGKAYDPGYRGRPTVGGTTTLVYDTRKRELVRHFLSLACTETNCAGGPTPWGTWITCEETVARRGRERQVDHGYNFEVPASAEIGMADPVPLKAMGRFNHEAIAVDPKSGVVYQTEDRQDGVLYRFIPNVPGKMAEGGRLQVLVVTERPSADLRNWPEIPAELLGAAAQFEGPDGEAEMIPVGRSMKVHWIDIDDVLSPEDDLRYRAFKAGAARFARNEGMWHGNDAVYFAATTGGSKGKGQIWRYVPSPNEGTDSEADGPATLELFIEPNDEAILQHADNLCVSDFGDVIVCEDGGPVNHVLGVTPEGAVYKLARNTMNKSEMAGSCFSPDGTTLFVNIQNPGLTLAITGPWAS